MIAPVESPALYRGLARDRLADAVEHDRRVAEIIALESRLASFYLRNGDLVASVLGMSGLYWRWDPTDKVNVVGTLDERGERCFEQRRVSSADALLDVVRAVADWHRARAESCREQAADHLIEAESLEPTPTTAITTTNANAA